MNLKTTITLFILIGVSAFRSNAQTPSERYAALISYFKIVKALPKCVPEPMLLQIVQEQDEKNTLVLSMRENELNLTKEEPSPAPEISKRIGKNKNKAQFRAITKM